MKILLNWRYYVMAAMMAAGALLVFGAGGDFANGTGLAAEMLTRAALAASGFAVLYVMHRLTSKWERDGEIPEFTNQKYN